MSFRDTTYSAIEALSDELRSNAKLRESFFNVAVHARAQESQVQISLRDSVGAVTGLPSSVVCEHPVSGMPNDRWDIAVLSGSDVIGIIEIKAPMTNHDGIRHKTNRAQGLPRDVEKLRIARLNGIQAMEVFALFEVYGLTSDGEPEPAFGRTIRAYERDINRDYGIKWPTRHDYSPQKGRQQVEDACIEQGLNLIRDWQRTKLSPSISNVAAYIDLGCFALE